MADLVIRKKDIENLGRKTMKEVYEFLNDDYILKTFEEMKVEQKKLKEYLVNSYLRMIYKVDEINYGEINSDEEIIDKYTKELEDESKYDKYLKELVAKIKDESLDIKIIYHVLDRIKLEFEIHEDLFDKKKAFIYFYSIYYFYDYYLKE